MLEEDIISEEEKYFEVQVAGRNYIQTTPVGSENVIQQSFSVKQ